MVIFTSTQYEDVFHSNNMIDAPWDENSNILVSNRYHVSKNKWDWSASTRNPITVTRFRSRRPLRHFAVIVCFISNDGKIPFFRRRASFVVASVHLQAFFYRRQSWTSDLAEHLLASRFQGIQNSRRRFGSGDPNAVSSFFRADELTRLDNVHLAWNVRRLAGQNHWDVRKLMPDLMRLLFFPAQVRVFSFRPPLIKLSDGNPCLPNLASACVLFFHFYFESFVFLLSFGPVFTM